MAIYTIHAGHGAVGKGATGAVGIVSESDEVRLIKDSAIKYLEAMGHTVYDCTVDYGTQSEIISNIKRNINSYDNVTANISIHLNASNGSAHGTECEVYSNTGLAKEIGNRINSYFEDIGYTNRGNKERTNLGVLKGITNGGANVLVECFFCDNEYDCNLYEQLGYDTLGKILAEAITGESINNVSINETQEAQETKQNTNNMEVDNMWATFSAQGKGTWFFDGTGVRLLGHPDELSIMNMIYKANTGRDIPHFSFGENDPWDERLKAVLAKPYEDWY